MHVRKTNQVIPYTRILLDIWSITAWSKIEALILEETKCCRAWPKFETTLEAYLKNIQRLKML